MDPEVLLRCAHDLFLDNLVHIGSGLIFICRVAFHLWGDKQTISAVIRFSYHRYGQHGCARETGENIGAIGCGDIFHRKERREGAAFTTIILIGSKPYRFTFLQCTDNAAQIISADHRFVRAHAPTGLHPFHQLIIMWTIGSHHWLAQSHHAAAQFQRHKMDADNHYAAILHLCAFRVIQPFNIKPFTYATVGPEPCHAGFYQRHAE
ncbi:Uncharacterised protein [Shigella sonnei]|nr:Uncharacterised protein [Shigella sonnei]